MQVLRQHWYTGRQSSDRLYSTAYEYQDNLYKYQADLNATAGIINNYGCTGTQAVLVPGSQYTWTASSTASEYQDKL